MGSSLVNLDDYGLITFYSTTQALKAQKTLQAAGTGFLIIPIPREISASCGLAVKTRPEEVESQRDLLVRAQVIIGGIYHIGPGGQVRSIARASSGDDL